ncbi:hypothetical protein [Gluconobacter sp. P1D12_c]|uniref:hypothetical protein n=1 Tax=Gluconobacter sp. P1D12_c TaxID=2762614 RepID=UPI001C046BC1|nr:hypothetical protein [Gluconobacter sp. P1D12_c]
MTGDRLQSAWRYTGAELWRPLFAQFADAHPDLPVEIVRTLLVRPRGMATIFVDAGRYSALDALRVDAATYLDSVADARVALRRIKPQFFVGGRAIAILLADIAVALEEYDSPNLEAAYRTRLEQFVGRHMLPYRLDCAPLRLTPLLHGEIDGLYQSLLARTAVSPQLKEALAGFENAWQRQSVDWSQINAKEAIRTASLLAENMLVSASAGQENEFSRALTRMRNGNRFPSNEFANIFDRAYTFANTYPNIRHPGNHAVVKRDLRREDAVLAALVFVGLSACVHDLCEDAG